jgi:hypothetical protein
MVQPWRAFGIVIIGAVAASATGCIFERYGEDARITARIKARDLASKAELYYLQNDNKYPPNIEWLAEKQPNGLSPLCSQEAIMDPWGREYQLRIDKDEKGNDRIEVFTFVPATGERISNLGSPAGPPEGPPSYTAMIVTIGLVVALLVVVWLFKEPKQA